MANIATDGAHHLSTLNTPSSKLLFHPKTWCTLSVVVCVLMKSPLCCLRASCAAPALQCGAPQLVVHKVLVEVDAKQRADHLAGSHPPGEEGKEASEEERSEDGPQRCEGL